MLSASPQRQQGFAGIGALIVVSVMMLVITLYQMQITQERERQKIERQGRYMADYLNAVAGFLADQGQTAPDASTIAGLSATGTNTFQATGTDWLKNTNCGGAFSPDEAHLGCSLPTNFNLFFGLGAPSVTFDYTNQPQASIDFGIVQDNGPDPITAGALVRVINGHLEAAGYQHINVYHIANADNSDVGDANLRATIDSQSASDIYVRRDGVGEMTGPLLTEHNNWALIARDENGNEVTDNQSATASANVNDVYVRSADAWVSETHELAKEAYTRAIQSPQFMTETGPGPLTVQKPECPNGLTPQIFVKPVVFVGGNSNKRLISGVRRQIIGEDSTSWDVRLQISWDDGTSSGSGWQVPPSDFGRMQITTKCS